MSYLVLARKWRPQRFDDVVGQAHVTKTLGNAIEMDRVAHAFLFTGVRGVGKTSLARIMAKALNCSTGPTPNPCGKCDNCKAITSGTAVDVIEIDGASNNSVEDIRNLRETVPFRPVLGRFKIYVIDEVHMLSTSAFNALLKTLEEPPPHVKFIFATTESHKIPITILSRCQRYDFRRIPAAAIIGRLAHILENEKIGFEDGALSIIGREAEGSMRDALSILDQVLAAGGDHITADSVGNLLGLVERQVFLDLSESLLTRNPKRCLEIIKAVDDQGYDISTFAKGLLDHLRNLVVAGVCQGEAGTLDLPAEEIDALTAQAKTVSLDALHRLFKHFSEAYEGISRSAQPKILLEMALARIADLGELVPAIDIIKRLERVAQNSSVGTGGGSNTGGGGIPIPKQPSGPSQPDAPTYQIPGRQVAPGTESPKPFTPPQAPKAPPSQVQTPRSQAPQSQTSSQAPRNQAPAVQQAVRSPMPAPASAPKAAQGTPPTPAQWEAAISDMKTARPATASLLEYSKIDTSTGQMVVTFHQSYASIAKMTEDRGADMKAYLRERLNFDVQILIRVTENEIAPSAAKKRIEEEDRLRAVEDSARSHPLVRQIQSAFGARVSNVQLKRN